MKRNIFIVFLCILTCGYYYNFFLNRAYVELEIEVSQDTKLKIYWEKENKNFTEKKRIVVPIAPGKERYEFFLTDFGSFDKLRIDPVQYEGTVVLKRITLSQRGYKSIDIDFTQLKPLNDIVNYSVENGFMGFISGGGDPNFLYVPVLEKEAVNWPHVLLLMFLLSGIVIIVTKSCSPLKKDFGYVPVMLSMVLVLLVTMAVVSKRNAHPDEYVHLRATSYYQDHWLPPQIDDKDIESTYSVYGSSRLNNGEIYYLLAGKVSKAMQPFKISKLLSLRIFNILLFATIVLYATYSITARVVALPFLISPQVWYIFSYCGSDALGLFLCFIAGCELIRSNSILNRLLRGVSSQKLFLPIIVIAVLLAMLLLLKKNYYPFLAFFYICLGWRIFKLENNKVRTIFITKVLIVSVIAILFAGFRVGLDYYVNGFDRQEKIALMEERTAHDWYKPSSALEDKHVSLYLKDRGTSLKTVVFNYKWFQKSFCTGFGLYSYFSISASEGYYNLVKWASGFLLLYIILLVSFKGGFDDIALLCIAIGLSLALIGVSLYHSWTMDFQAQGRYLFPILPMFGIVLGRGKSFVNTRMMVLGVSQLYLLGLYSFIFIALVNIPRP